MPADRRISLSPFRSLSARLLVLTILFVMIAEVLILAPSLARFRWTYFEDRIASAHLAALALEAAPEAPLSPALRDELLGYVGVHSIVLQKTQAKALVLTDEIRPDIDDMVSLRRGGFFDKIAGAFETLMQSDNRVLRVRGPSPYDRTLTVEIVIDETPLREAMIDFAQRILALSIIISLMAAALVYFALLWLLVRPMRRLTESMIAFHDHPEDPNRVIEPSARRDEIGVAERELAAMQTGLRGALAQRARLAALGEAVAKINHDLRNILSTAQLVSDRLATSSDPQVRRSTPVLMKAIDRAIALCTRTLDFARPRPEIVSSDFRLRDLVIDVTASLLPLLADKAEIMNSVGADLVIHADREQLARVLSNLLRNAAQAGATRIAVGGRLERAPARRIVIDVADNGPGLPAHVQQRLFQPFVGTSREGGSGLGLAIVRDLVRAHGGDVTLVSTGEDGSAFRLVLPQPDRRRRRQRRAAPAAVE